MSPLFDDYRGMLADLRRVDMRWTARVAWLPPLMGCNVIAGIDDLTLASGGSAASSSLVATATSASSTSTTTSGTTTASSGSGGGAGCEEEWVWSGPPAGSFICVRALNGAVRCWGYGGRGELGDGQSTISNIPVTPLGLPPSSNLVGSGAVFSIGTSGSLHVWGENLEGSFGQGNSQSSSVPIPITFAGFAGSQLRSIDTSTNTCVVSTQGEVWCSGSNYYGIVDPSAVADIDIDPPQRVEELGNDNDEVVLSDDDACVRKTDGRVFCWGLDEFGEFAATNDVHPPTLIPGLTATKGTLQTTQDTVCALDATTSALRCRGSGYSPGGFLGATLTDIALPIGTIKQFSMGGSHLCAVDNAGAAACFGYNQYLQLGQSNGTTDGAFAINLPTTVRYINAAYRTTVVILTDNRVMTFGSNINDQLGQGVPESALFATHVPGEVMLCR
jgi:alpha-tubulin suppressor-like RCC1 family protein